MTSKEETLKEAHDYIKKTPVLRSLLYDMDLMPEQVDEGTLDHRRMIILALTMKRLLDKQLE